MGDNELFEAVPVPAESALILSGPDDSIFDDIFDWIANAIATIVSTVTDWINRAWAAITSTISSWITWLWDNVIAWFTWLGDLIASVRDYIVSWVSSKVSELWSWITTRISGVITTVGAWFSEQWSRISQLFASWFSTVSQLFAGWFSTVEGWFTSMGSQLEGWFTWLGDFFRDQVIGTMSGWWTQLLDRLLDVGSWIGSLMDGIASWLSVDIPGHSPRWTAIFDGIGDWFKKWLWEFPQWMFGNFPERVAYGLSTSLKWVGEIFNEIFETFMDAVMGIVRQIGPTNPSTVMSSYSAMAKVGLIALGGLAGMTIAGETLNPISHLGLGHISAMIYDMTNYKLITGVFMGVLTFAMLKMPLTYYFNEMFRPLILDYRDFMELMSRDAFRNPQLLQEPDLIASVQQLTGGNGTAWEARMIGFYGYPAQYHGLFRELSHTRLGYFALAGIARTGFWDEAWFVEALARTGYSFTAREALLRMYKEQVKYARQQPVMYQLRQLARDGYYTIDQVKDMLATANEMESVDDIRIMAMALEQEYQTFSTALDISLRAFSRGVIPESECRKNLTDLNVPGDLVDIHLTREKLGLLRRIPWTPPMEAPGIPFGEE